MTIDQTEQEPGDTGDTDTGEEEQTDTGEEQTDTLEARKYRRRAQAAEERAEELSVTVADLTERIDRLRRSHVERIVSASGLADPADFWLVHPDPKVFLDLNGDVVDTAVSAAVNGILIERPHWGKRKSAPDPNAGRNPEPPVPTDKWSAALRKR